MTIKRKSELEQLINDIHSYGINYHTRELYLHGNYVGSTDTDSEPGVEYRMATTFVKNAHILEGQSQSNILVHMHSIGGEWRDGMAIFNTIRFIKSPVTIIAYGEATSASGIVLQAADNRVLMPDTEFMIHHGSISLEDSSAAVKSAVDVNERLCKRMLSIFAKRSICGEYFTSKQYNLNKIMAFIDRKIHKHGDWYLSSEEAVYYGFADGVLGEKGFETTAKVRNPNKVKLKL